MKPYLENFMPPTEEKSDPTQREQEHILANVFAYARVFTVSAIALNGGATLILLATVAMSLTPANDASLLLVTNLPIAMSWFTYGVGYGAAIAGFAYFAHVFFVRANWHEQGRAPATTNSIVKLMNNHARTVGNICMGISVLAGISSYVCFIRASFLISDTAALLNKS
jgi:energy-converting hydrogenase Eha subunit E